MSDMAACNRFGTPAEFAASARRDQHSHAFAASFFLRQGMGPLYAAHLGAAAAWQAAANDPCCPTLARLAARSSREASALQEATPMAPPEPWLGAGADPLAQSLAYLLRAGHT